MGLLDSLKFSTGDPEKDAQLNRGLLQMGLQLMQSRGRLFPALGQAGMVGLQAADQTRQMQQQQRESEQMRQMRQLQIGQAQRQAQIEALPGQFYRAPSSPAMDATGGMETAVENPNNASGPGGFDMAGYIQALRGMAPVQSLQLEQMMAPKPRKLGTLKPGEAVYDEQTGQMVPGLSLPAEPPKPAADIAAYELVAKQYTEAGKQPPTFEQWDLARRRAGATSISNAPYAPVLPVLQPDGTTTFIQPGSRPGQAPGVVIDPTTNKPAVKPPEGGGKPPAEIQRMNAAADTMAALLGDYEAWLKANNPRDPTVQMNPAMRAQAQARMKNIQLQFKELQLLGALAGPDLALMEAAITDPFTFRGAMYGREGLMGQIGEARRLIDVRRKAMAAQAGGPAKPADAAPNADPLGLRSK